MRNTFRTFLGLRVLRNAYLIRGALVWVVVRLALAFYQLLSSESAGLDLEPLAEVWLIGVVGVTVLLDARRRSEDVLLGNLGVPAWMIAVMGSPLAALLEVLVP